MHSLSFPLAFVLVLLSGTTTRAQSAQISGPLAHSPGQLGGDVLEARTTPDGSRIVYRADQETPDVIELYSVLSDGSAAPVRLSAVDPADSRGDIDYFRIAPDGAYVVFGNEEEHLYTAPVDGSAPAVEIAPSVDQLQAVITPDGSAVVWVREGALFIGPIDGGSAPTLLVSGNGSERIESLALTPDGASAVYITQECFDLQGCTPRRLAIVPLDGSSAALTLDPGYVTDFSIASDSSRAAYRRTTAVVGGTLFSVPLDGSAAGVNLTPGLVAGGSIADYELSPNADRVVYLADQAVNERYELYSVALDASGPPVRLNGTLVTNGDVAGAGFPTSEGAFQITPDGQRVVYRADQNTNEVFELFSVQIAGGFAVLRSGTMVPGADVRGFQASPDSVGVLFLADRLVFGNVELFAVPFSGGPPLRLNPPLPPGGDVLQFQISPDDQQVVYRAVQDDAVTHGSELHRVGILGGDEVTLGGVHPFDGGWPALTTWSISPDSSKVAYVLDEDTDDQDELFGVPILGGVPPVRLNAPLPSGPPSGDVFQWVVSSDGGTLVYLADGDQNDVMELYRVSTTGGGFAKLNAPLPPGGAVAENQALTLTPDGTRVVYLAEQGENDKVELYSAPTDASQAPVKLNHALSAGLDVSWPFEVSLDGQRVAYLASAAGGILELHGTRVDGTGIPVLLSAPGQDVQPSNARPELHISPDGARVVYRSGVDLYAVPMDGSQAPVRLNPAFGAGGAVGAVQSFMQSFAISPDSRSVAYLADAVIDGRIELYHVPIRGGRAPTRLNGPLVPGGDVIEFAFAAGERVVYHADEELDERFELYSAPLDARWTSASLAAGPRPRRVKLNAPLAGSAVVGSACCGGDSFTLSPDGSLAAFHVRDGFSSSDVWIVPVDRSTAPTQLTTGYWNTGWLSFSPDGSRLLYAASSPAGGLYTVFVDGSQAPVQLSGNRLAGDEDSDEAPYRVSPDGLCVVYRADEDVVERFDLYARPLDASVPAQRLTQPFTSGSVASRPFLAFTPDSARIVYRADHVDEDVLELFSSPLP